MAQPPSGNMPNYAVSFLEPQWAFLKAEGDTNKSLVVCAIVRIICYHLSEVKSLNSRRQFLCVASGAALVTISARSAVAKVFPTRPVTLIVPFSAGGTTDVVLRALAAASERHLGQPIVIENHGGAGGTLGPALMAANAKPDGYTVSQIPFVLFRDPAIRQTNYDPATDFSYIIGVSAYTFGVAVRSDAPWRTFLEFLADAKARPGQINYGITAPNGLPNTTMLQIARQQGIGWISVPFKGVADAINALLGGHIHAIAELDRVGPAGGCRPIQATGFFRRGSHKKLARSTDIEGNRDRLGRERSVWHSRPQRNGRKYRQGPP